MDEKDLMEADRNRRLQLFYICHLHMKRSEFLSVLGYMKMLTCDLHTHVQYRRTFDGWKFLSSAMRGMLRCQIQVEHWSFVVKSLPISWGAACDLFFFFSWRYFLGHENPMADPRFKCARRRRTWYACMETWRGNTVEKRGSSHQP